MHMEMKENIISLFRKYGFEYNKAASHGDFLAFTFKSGFFHNAEIGVFQGSCRLNC